MLLSFLENCALLVLGEIKKIKWKWKCTSATGEVDRISESVYKTSKQTFCCFKDSCPECIPSPASLILLKACGYVWPPVLGRCSSYRELFRLFASEKLEADYFDASFAGKAAMDSNTAHVVQFTTALGLWGNRSHTEYYYIILPKDQEASLWEERE